MFLKKIRNEKLRTIDCSIHPFFATNREINRGACKRVLSKLFILYITVLSEIEVNSLMCAKKINMLFIMVNDVHILFLFHISKCKF